MLGLFAVSASFLSDKCQLNTADSLEIRLTIIVKSDGPKNWYMSIPNNVGLPWRNRRQRVVYM